MTNKAIRRLVLVLILASALIYGIQILVFRDIRDTGFYILQDLAFLPLTVAIATIVIGDFLDEKEKEERLEKSRMLTSSFFSAMGTELTRRMLPALTYGPGMERVRTIIQGKGCEGEKQIDRVQAEIRSMDLSLRLDEETYEDVRELLMEKHESLLILASNPLLLEHECFTELLWSLFHLIDEMSLRGAFMELGPADLSHLEEDFQVTFRLLLQNWASNAGYMKENYPNFAMAVRERLLKTAARRREEAARAGGDLTGGKEETAGISRGRSE